MRPEPPTSPADIGEAWHRIAPYIRRTPAIPSPSLSRAAGSEIRLKLETLQPTGSFKVRGAAAKILDLDDRLRRRGVVTASTGNHGKAVAYIAKTLAIPVTVCVSSQVPRGKLAALESMGCRVQVAGASQAEALEVAAALASDAGPTLVHPFDDRVVIAGQGTIGLEVAGEAPETRNVIVPLSGGGLISGIGLAVKSTSPSTRVIGVSMSRSAAMKASLDAGHPVSLKEKPSLADSLQGDIGVDNRYTFRMVQTLVDEIALVEEEEIWKAMLWAYRTHGLVLEGGGAVGIAALLAHRIEPAGPTTVICSGRNLEASHLEALGREMESPPSGPRADRQLS
ncbi:MAG: pyridoxal-phosphate dependent enzyme [Acidimicrobiia bacterium]